MAPTCASGGRATGRQKITIAPLPPQTPPGDYEIAVGLYDFTAGVRLPAVDAAGGNCCPDDAILLTTIAVERK